MRSCLNTGSPVEEMKFKHRCFPSCKWIATFTLKFCILFVKKVDLMFSWLFQTWMDKGLLLTNNVFFGVNKFCPEICFTKKPLKYLEKGTALWKNPKNKTVWVSLVVDVLRATIPTKPLQTKKIHMMTPMFFWVLPGFFQKNISYIMSWCSFFKVSSCCIDCYLTTVTSW